MGLTTVQRYCAACDLTDYKIGLRLSVSLCVRLWEGTLTVAFLDGFSPKLTHK